jgi:hypothetical protein
LLLPVDLVVVTTAAAFTHFVLLVLRQPQVVQKFAIKEHAHRS